jgi:hypothetical protein
VNTLYGDPSRVQEASQWLTAFQESQVDPSLPFACVICLEWNPDVSWAVCFASAFDQERAVLEGD